MRALIDTLSRTMLARFGFLLVMSLALAFAAPAFAADPVGDWQGVLTIHSVDLTLALHVKKTATGYDATFDDVTLSARGLAVTGFAAAGEDKIGFDVPAAHGRYDAVWDAGKSQWVGAWTSPGAEKGLPLQFARGAPPPPPHIAGLDGEWRGVINIGAAGVMSLVFHIHTDADGTRATVDSPDQGAGGIPVSSVQRTGRTVDLDMGLIKAAVVGDLSDDGTEIQGEFTQGPLLTAILLKRSGDGPPVAAGKPMAGMGIPKTWSLPDDAAVKAILARRIDTERRGVGIVVGMIGPEGRRVVAYGAPALGDPRRVDGETLFEIGSISKTFIALVLQDMALKGEVGLDDPVAKYLPPGTKVPSRGGKQITLRELAMHTAGLPHDMPNPGAKRPEDMFDNMTEANLYQFLATYPLSRDPGDSWEYSNLGAGLLGVALSRRAGVDLETLIHQRVLAPLDMDSTVLKTMTPAEAARLATGHDPNLRPEPAIDIGVAEEAAGQIRSSADDMLKYLAAELGYTKTPLRPAMDAMLSQDRPGLEGGYRQALGWMILDWPGGRIVTHSGGTFGQRAFAAFNPKTRQGVIVLSNAEGGSGADDIGLYVIAGVPVAHLAPAPPPYSPVERAEAPLSAQAAKPYLGRYRMSRSIELIVGYAADHLTLSVDARGQVTPPQAVVYHGGNDFSASDAGRRRSDMTFQVDASGQASGMIWRGPSGEFHLRRE